MGVDGWRHAQATLSLEMTRYPLYRRVGRSNGAENSPAPGFDPRNDQPVASPYTKYATPAHITIIYAIYLLTKYIDESP